jgi:hypothetical protein
VKSFPKLCLCLALASCALAGGLVRVAPAGAASPCWKALLNDWYDGRIDHIYARHCYDDALKHLPPDVETYSSARDDIERALQSATAKNRRAGKQTGPNALVVPSARPKGGKNGKTQGGAPAPGRKPAKGLSGVADKLNPGSASSIPVPLLVLGALALLLVAAGGTGLVAKRIQARRQGP